ncbi:UNVERIFIED_ORG: hypothetical protein J2X79_001037 [Arthrobacter globiformis]|nr:hypothetical protein [Arthrobacter globiformis]
MTFNAGRPEGGPTRRVIQTQSITETSRPVLRGCGFPVLSLAKVSGKILPVPGPFTENEPGTAG